MIQPMLAPHTYNKKRERNKKEKGFQKQANRAFQPLCSKTLWEEWQDRSLYKETRTKKNVRGNRALRHFLKLALKWDVKSFQIQYLGLHFNKNMKKGV